MNPDLLVVKPEPEILISAKGIIKRGEVVMFFRISIWRFVKMKLSPSSVLTVVGNRAC